jgi:V-type sodium ATP synthase
VDDSYLYRDLLDSVWQEESYRLAQDIFKDQAE